MMESGGADPDPLVTTGSDGPSKTGGAAAAAVGVSASATSSAAHILQAEDAGPGPSGQNEHPPPASGNLDGTSQPGSWLNQAKHTVLTFGKFVGPGFMVAVAYSLSTPIANRAHLIVQDWLTQS
jgi:metal iron transporter